MKRALSLAILFLVATAVLCTVASAKRLPREPLRFESRPSRGVDLPPDLTASRTPMRSAAVLDTFVLHEANFDGPGGAPDPMGYVGVDRTAQIGTFFHVADANELDGGESGAMVPLSGMRSMWCGQAPSSVVPFCGYATLPGYANNWDQRLVSGPLPGDSVSLSYRVFWDSEPSYDFTAVEYSFDGGATWSRFQVGDVVSGLSGVYDNAGPTPYVDESLTANAPGASDVRLRFRFKSDGVWSDEDGIWATDGAIILDDIAIDTWNAGVPAASEFEDFESTPVGSHTAGIWTTALGPAFGDFASLYQGVTVLQEDPCVANFTAIWGFFDEPPPGYLCHTPDPVPNQGILPFGITTADGEALYLNNEIWSPPFAITGQGDQYRLSFSVYRDLPFSNLQVYLWSVRNWSNGCPGPWKGNFLGFDGDQRDWFRHADSFGQFVDPGADQLQIAITVMDFCINSFYCQFFAGCHSHAPLIDNIRVERIGGYGPQVSVQHYELFQDNFSEDGTLTGTARADMASDILPSVDPRILPGDSVAVTIGGVAEVGPGMGPRAYLYAGVWPPGTKTGAAMESSDTRPGKAGPRFPYAGSEVIDGVTWERFQMDTVVAYGNVVDDRYCVDLNDALFTPGDTICYFFGADADAIDNNGNEVYWHRTFNGQGESHLTDDIAEAAASPCEFTILPTDPTGAKGIDILFVDEADDRGGPAQLFFDNALYELGLNGRVDRYDVLAPTSAASNGPASRVKNANVQFISFYQNVIWNTSDLFFGLGDGVSPEKQDDFGLLETMIRTSPLDPGLLLMGDDLAENWVSRFGTSANDLRDWIPFLLVGGSHTLLGESVTPVLTATGFSFIHSAVPDEFYAYGGCPVINDFDVLRPASSSNTTSIMEFQYPNSGESAVISSQGMNDASTYYTIVLAGLGFESIVNTGANQGQGAVALARAEFLYDVLIKMAVIVPVTGVHDPDEGPELANALDANYPNPFNPLTTIRYRIKEKAHVSLRIYNAAGQLVRTLVDEVQSPAEVKPLTWDGTNQAGQEVSSGVYFYKLVTKDFAKTRKMVLLK